MSTLTLPEEMLRVIHDQAVAEYPGECCGMIFARREHRDVLTRVRPCRNVQDEYHAKAPHQFTRTSKTAYFIDPAELMAIEKELRQQGEVIRVIYHSHIDVDAYFSEEDVRMAVADGEPIYPGVAYLVLSVRKRRVADQKLFVWDSAEARFRV